MSLCIATFRRPVGLARLLGALETLEIPPGVRLQVVVIDNDASGSAQAVCDEAAARHAHPIRYAIEKRRGIPFARNAALAVALPESDFIAFIDDDEVPEPDWLAELLRVQACYRADVVTGPCLPRYLESPPPWVSKGAFHDAPRFPTGTLRHVAFTHNALVRASVFECLDSHFDESMALNGGDDAEFFSRAFESGYQIVWADNAIAHEIVPASRSTVRWLLQRSFRTGTSTAWMELKHRSSSPIRLSLHGISCALKGAAVSLALPLRGRSYAVGGLCMIGYGIGRIAGASGYLHQEYRVVHGA